MILGLILWLAPAFLIVFGYRHRFQIFGLLFVGGILVAILFFLLLDAAAYRLFGQVITTPSELRFLPGGVLIKLFTKEHAYFWDQFRFELAKAKSGGGRRPSQGLRIYAKATPFESPEETRSRKFNEPVFTIREGIKDFSLLIEEVRQNGSHYGNYFESSGEWGVAPIGSHEG